MSDELFFFLRRAFEDLFESEQGRLRNKVKGDPGYRRDVHRLIKDLNDEAPRTHLLVLLFLNV